MIREYMDWKSLGLIIAFASFGAVMCFTATAVGV